MASTTEVAPPPTPPTGTSNPAARVLLDRLGAKVRRIDDWRGDLSITVEDNQLVVRGRQTDDTQRVYLHRGIAARQFQRSFVLAEGIEVNGALLDNGLLHIDLVRPEAESRVRNVEITMGSTAAKRAPVGSGS